MSSPRCTCCHICHTSLKTSKRDFFPCSDCPTIICRQCVELTGQDWDHVNSLEDWSCPRCCGDCPCKRCRNKVNSSPPKSSEKRKLNKRKRAAATIFEDNGFATKVQKTERQTTPKKSLVMIPEDKNQRIEELCNKNKQCLDYISRTERLLNLIRSEQGRIQEELESLSKKSTVKSDSTKELLDAAESAYLEDTSDSGDSTSSDEYDGDLDFAKCQNNESLVFPARKANLLA